MRAPVQAAAGSQCAHPTWALAEPCARLLRSYDEHSHEKFPPGDPSKRAFTYFVLTGGRFIYASALRLAVLKFVLSMTVRLRLCAAASLAMGRPGGKV